MLTDTAHHEQALWTEYLSLAARPACRTGMNSCCSNPRVALELLQKQQTVITYPPRQNTREKHTRLTADVAVRPWYQYGSPILSCSCAEGAADPDSNHGHPIGTTKKTIKTHDAGCKPKYQLILHAYYLYRILSGPVILGGVKGVTTLWGVLQRCRTARLIEWYVSYTTM